MVKKLKIEISGLPHSGKSTIAIEIKKLLDSLGIKNILSDDQDIENQDKRLSALKDSLEVEIACKQLQRSGIFNAPKKGCRYFLAITDGIDDFQGVGVHTGKVEDWGNMAVYEFLTENNDLVMLASTDTILEIG